ncbi:MAG: phosphate ABC transporter permease PtsA [Acidobacteria bacterium]|nr:MAG: phosphate ABC transporter permease PtsA [Acidobacteriota bacterium]REJ99526.1 MAG: phosphate ABC transporter permease PtsA [Acidobacteriota bacterium]
MRPGEATSVQPGASGSPVELTAGAQVRSRRRRAAAFRWFCMVMTLSGLVFLALLLYQVLRDGVAWLDLDFLRNFPSRRPERAGIKSALYGSVWMIGFTAAFSIPVGVAAALYLEEYAKPSRLTTFIQINIANLAGVPSIVYGMLGLVLFVRGLQFGRSVLAGSLTMSLLILPVIIIASREAIRAVPLSMRQAAFALGATRWQVVRDHVLPAAVPGIITGVILALSRALGETAPLIMIGALTYVAFVPEGPMDAFTALPIQIYNWASRPQAEFHELAAAGIIVLLVLLFVLNSAAVYIRYRAGRRSS